MTIADWMDFGWAYLMRQTPMMANPFEYRESMWNILHGVALPPKASKAGDKPEQKALPAGPRRAPNRAEWDKLAALNADIERIKQERET